MPAQLQVKLLRAVQDRKIQRLGGSHPLPIDTRLIAATNRDLEAAVAAGSFGEDLYYRLNIVRIHLPPLHERRQDIPLLVARILTRLNARMGRHIAGLTPAALAALESYHFPGNVRELENVLERASIFCESESIDRSDIDLPHDEVARTPRGRR